MSKRPPNELESKLHQAALSAPKQELTNKQTEAIIPDAKARQSALNFLLGVGLFKSLASANGSLLFRAVTKNELNATKDLSGEEALVLNHIKGSRNEGIWTKHLKAKTNLHQTIIDRCLKTLVQKKLIKRVPSVQHQTRKIYMLEHLEPSIALTGGPWYTDNELDTEFIKLLNSACLRFIQDKSFPKRRTQETQQPILFPISNSPPYPTAQHIRNFLKQSRITETDLSVEHVEMLLNVLVLDGEIEKIPAFGATLWDSSVIDDGAESVDEEERRSKKKRKHKDEDEDDGPSASKSKRRKRAIDGDEDSDASPTVKKSKKKRARGDSDLDTDDEKAKRRKKKKGGSNKDSMSSTDEDGNSSRKKSKKKKSKRKQESSSESESSSSSESESDSHSRRDRKVSNSQKRSPSPFQPTAFDDFAGSAHVYRAIRQERVALGWSQAPCGECPSFDFCHAEGPVNPHECVYYGDWLVEPVGGSGVATDDW